jgi:uncharacterized damage-inducible protein DinB
MDDVEGDEHGRPDTPLAAGEVATLLGFLDHQRATLDWKCRGLNDEELAARLAPTAMTLGGLLLHLARVEEQWFSEVVAERPREEPWASMPWAAEWTSFASDSGDELRRRWAESVERSRRVVAALLASEDQPLGETHPAWGGQARVSLRWVLVHMIEEYARHNGHADLLREAIDGQTGE